MKKIKPFGKILYKIQMKQGNLAIYRNVEGAISPVFVQKNGTIYDFPFVPDYVTSPFNLPSLTVISDSIASVSVEGAFASLHADRDVPRIYINAVAPKESTYGLTGKERISSFDNFSEVEEFEKITTTGDIAVVLTKKGQLALLKEQDSMIFWALLPLRLSVSVNVIDCTIQVQKEENRVKLFLQTPRQDYKFVVLEDEDSLGLKGNFALSALC